MKIEKETVFGLLFAASVGAFGGEIIKTYVPYLISFGKTLVSDRYVQINYPSWYNGVPSKLAASVIDRGEDPTSYKRHPFDGKRALVITDDVPNNDIEIFITIDEEFQTKYRISDPIERFSRRVVFDVPQIDSAWDTLVLTKKTIMLGESPDMVIGNEHPWLQIAKNEIGVRERFDYIDPNIDKYWMATTFQHSQITARTPWGCAFVAWVLKEAKLDETLLSPRCGDWVNFGSALEGPAVGAIAVFEPFIDESLSGFAGFITEFDDATVTIVGGNISDSVAVRRYPLSRVRAYRWPKEI